jgi:tetratricopeptide (TPR) repeat protein
MFKSALEIAQVTQTSQASWATTWLNLGTSLRKLGQLDEARDAYVKVLEIDSRSAPALGFLGLVYHLMDQLDDAIVKYHEVSPLTPFRFRYITPDPVHFSPPLFSTASTASFHVRLAVTLYFNFFFRRRGVQLLMTDALLHAGTEFHLFFFSGPVS